KKIKVYKKVLVVLTSAFVLVQLSKCSDEVPMQNSEISTETKELPDWVQRRIDLTEKAEQEKKISDEELLAMVDTWEQDIDGYLAKGDWESVKERATGHFITITDFLFFEGTLTNKEGKTLTRKDISEATAEKVATTYLNALAKVESIRPGFVDTLTDRYEKGKPYIFGVFSTLGQKTLETGREQLSEEQYNNIQHLLDIAKYQTNNTIENAKELWETGSEWAASTYQDFKNNRENNEEQGYTR
ncbi:MAG: hypothetical protein PHN72_04480, partial [Bacilli bacterium]|nr:hypothetical protein [Bacilli bacterium]